MGAASSGSAAGRLLSSEDRSSGSESSDGLEEKEMQRCNGEWALHSGASGVLVSSREGGSSAS